MTICMVVTKSGDGKPNLSVENIHLLYTLKTVANPNLTLMSWVQSAGSKRDRPCRDKEPIYECIPPPFASPLFTGNSIVDIDVKSIKVGMKIAVKRFEPSSLIVWVVYWRVSASHGGKSVGCKWVRVRNYKPDYNSDS